MMMLEESNPQDYLITQEKLEEMKGNIPRAGPKYRLGMYFETIHNLPTFDKDWHYDDGGYTSYWETDTEVDSDLGNFIFNNVGGESASVICIDDAVDIVSIRRRQQEAINMSKQCQPHYKIEQSRMSPSSSPSDDHSLECSVDSKHSSRSRHSHRSGSDGSYDQPPPVPPPRKSKALATAAAATNEFEDHTYETLDDCREDYLAHNQEMIYISKGSEGSRGSQESGLKPASTEDAESDRLSSNKGDDCGRRTPDRRASNGGAKPRSNSLHLSKAQENARQRRKMSDPSTSRKRRSEKVASKGSGYPAPMKGFPTGVSEEYVEYLSHPVSGCHSPDRNNTSGSGSPVAQREAAVSSPDRRKASSGQKTSTVPNHSHQKKGVAQPLVIKHKGKTYFVPVVDQKLEKELEKRSKSNNPTVSIKRHHFSSHTTARPNGVHGMSTLTSASHTHRLPASPPKVEPSDCASPNKRKGTTTSFKSPPHTANTKQVTHYGVF